MPVAMLMKARKLAIGFGTAELYEYKSASERFASNCNFYKKMLRYNMCSILVLCIDIIY